MSAETTTKIYEWGANASLQSIEEWDRIWRLSLGLDETTGGKFLFATFAYVGVIAGAFLLMFWGLQLYKDYQQGDWYKSFANVFLSLLLIMLMANQGALTAKSSYFLRGIINDINKEVLATAMGAVDLEKAYKEFSDQQAARQELSQRLLTCEGSTGESQKMCVTSAIRAAQQKADKTGAGKEWIDGVAGFLGPALDQFTIIDEGVAGAQKWSEGDFIGGVAEVGKGLFSGYTPAWEAIVFSLLAAGQQGYQAALEISLIGTSLAGPVAVGLSFIPVELQAKPLIAWFTGFFVIGLNKIVFNAIAGYAAIFALNAQSTDPMPMYFVFGFFAPVIASGVAALGGVTLWSGLTGAAKETASTAVKLVI